jgi:hypothetical protein
LSGTLSPQILNQRVVEELEIRLQNMRVRNSRISAEARVAAGSHGDNSALKRIAEEERLYKEDHKFLEEYMTELVELAGSLSKLGINNRSIEWLNEHIDYLVRMRDQKLGHTTFREKRKPA